MNLKKLNEELDRILMSEIRDELKQQVVNKRREQAQSAMDKYARSTRLAANKSGLKQSGRVGDEDLFKKIITQDLAEGESLSELIINNLDKLTIPALINILDNYDIYTATCGESAGLFPSCWNVEKFGPYPVKLAKALMLSKNAETLTDLFNVFYCSHRDKSAFKDAADVWADELKNNANKELKNMYELGADEDFLIDVFNELGDKFESVVIALAKAQEKQSEGSIKRMVNNIQLDDSVVDLLYNAEV